MDKIYFESCNVCFPKKNKIDPSKLSLSYLAKKYMEHMGIYIAMKYGYGKERVSFCNVKNWIK